MKRRALAAIALAALSVCSLTACSSGGPTPVPTGSGGVIDHSEQSTIDGEWVLTRTVLSSDDTNNPTRAVGAVSTRLVKFGDVACSDGPCTGGVLSGPTQAVRALTTFASAGDTIHYVFEGFVNCLRQGSTVVLASNGYAYTETIELKVIATDAVEESKATTLEGTLTYTDSLTNAALEAGCSRTPVATTTVYSLSAVRGAVVPVTSSTPAP